MSRGLLPVVIVAFLLSGCGYNTLQEYEEDVFKSWADVDATLQRRADLIPNLVKVVKGYAAHEKETLQRVVDARTRAQAIQISAKDLNNPVAMARLQAGQGQLSSALLRLLVVVEQYPQLKASENFLDLQNQLEGTENRINVARQRYNKAVSRFNASIRKFPYNLTNALLLHLERKEYFKAEQGARSAPKIGESGKP
ncbi:LemA family protein [Thermodesulfobacteriota bacterium]